MNTIPEDFILSIPKTDLHVHLDGSLRMSTLIDLAAQQGIPLPATTEEGLRRKVFKDHYASLDEYLKGFAYTCAVMQTPEALYRVSRELALDCFAEGVRYLEVRFAPQLHINNRQDFEAVMLSVDSGLKEARQTINATLGPKEPPFEFGIIVCAMRFCNEHFGAYYKNLFHLHNYLPDGENIVLASRELARAAVDLRDRSTIQIVGFDLAGSENGYPAIDHQAAYDYAQEHFLMKTVHAGEAYGAESIFQAITSLHANRIGHGLFLFDADRIRDPKITDQQHYIQRLANYIAERRITLEVCLTSNLQTVPQISDLSRHPLGKMLENRLSVSFCTDNRLVSQTTVSREIGLALKHFSIDRALLKDLIIYGFKRSFFYRPYPEKRAYVRKVINYYEELEKEYLR